jgi:hypothetical protein
MGKHLFHRMFQDLMSLHGYPLPFESVERVTGQAEAADYTRGYGNRAASARAFKASARPQAGAAPRACATGGCA